MAQAYELLAPGVRPEGKSRVGLDPERDYRDDADCLPCHSTGHGQPGGFVSSRQTPHMGGVQCEACHGPGGGADGYLSVMTLANKDHRLLEVTARGLLHPVGPELCTEACHNERSPHNAAADPRYAFDPAERFRTGGGHEHWKLQYDHGPMPPSYFQQLYPEQVQEP
jgi:hypothetical protein